MQVLWEVIPSETYHHCHQIMKSHSYSSSHHNHSGASSVITDDAEDLSLWGITPGLSNVPVISPCYMVDSFFQFMQEEEIRERHQAALLQLMEKDIMDKTKVSWWSRCRGYV